MITRKCFWNIHDIDIDIDIDNNKDLTFRVYAPYRNFQMNIFLYVEISSRNVP